MRRGPDGYLKRWATDAPPFDTEYAGRLYYGEVAYVDKALGLADRIAAEDVAINHAIGRVGLELLRDIARR